MLDAHADELAAGTPGRFHPLARIQPRGIEDVYVQIRVRPVGILEGGKSEMDEHPESQVHELLLEPVEALLLRREGKR